MSRRFSFVFLVALAVSTPSAHAQRTRSSSSSRTPAPAPAAPADAAATPPTDGTSASASAEARAYFQQGQAAYARGEYEEAVQAWEHAYSIDPRPALQYNLAQAYGRVGDFVHELRALETFVAGAPDTDSNVAPARMRITAIQERLARTGIRLVGVRPGVEVKIDDVVTEIPPDNSLIASAPGSHHVHARQQGHRPFDMVVEVAQGRTTEVVLSLPELAKPRPPILGYSLLGGGGALIVAGAITGGIALSKSGDAYRGTSGGDSAHALGLTTDILIGVGAAAAVTGFILVLTRDRGESDEYATFHFRPYASRGGAGLALDGRF